MRPNERFLSHSSVDRDAASTLAGILNEHGVPTFYAPEDLLGGQPWQDAILAALERCDWFAVLLTPDAITSMWVRRETAFALNERRYENKIVPLMYRPCELGSLKWLRLFQVLDFQQDFRGGCRDLLRLWGIDLGE
ncbi:MAG TPA: toll/interleukin-1 receptor domain-containing protein [Pirellulales bacterium]|jgi:hypothetical protein|nr:toll/interleukin-1 receptor domain-containing protein [Pirellulales bacterium]